MKDEFQSRSSTNLGNTNLLWFEKEPITSFFLSFKLYIETENANDLVVGSGKERSGIKAESFYLISFDNGYNKTFQLGKN